MCNSRRVLGHKARLFGGESKDAALRRTFKVSFCGFGLLLTLALARERERGRGPLPHQTAASASYSQGATAPCCHLPVQGDPCCHRTLNILSFLSDGVFTGLRDSQEIKDRGETEKEETGLQEKSRKTVVTQTGPRDTLPVPQHCLPSLQHCCLPRLGPLVHSTVAYRPSTM